jgi:phytoene dehydrogenase-like protein
MSKQRQKAIIVGAGIAGIAAAIRLANRGYLVTVFEANSYPGGKLSAFEQNGYRFDAGPSLFTMPQLVDELFSLCGKNPSAYFEYIRLQVVCQYFYEDGTSITAYSQPEKFAKEIEQKTGEPGSKVLSFLQDSQTKYELTAEVFLHRSLHKASTYLNAHAWKGYTNFTRLDVFRTMHQANKTRFNDRG